MKRLLLILLLLLSMADVRALRLPGTAEKLGWQPGDTLLIIPARIRSIPAFAFTGMTGLREVRFETGSRCLTIGDFAFACCDSLQRINLPPTVVVLGEGVFRECGELREISLPNGMLEVPKEAFLRCRSLIGAHLPERLLYIKGFAFAECENLDSISLPPRLQEIGNNAFMRTGLRHVCIPDNVTLIESYAFAGCKELESIKFPAVHNTLGELILDDCPSLRLIEEPSPSAPAFECESWLADPVSDPGFYKRVKLEFPEASRRDYEKSRGWKEFLSGNREKGAR